jgi:hypothetical protein
VRKALRIRTFKRELAPDDQRRLRAEIEANAGVLVPQQMLQWVGATLAVTERLAAEADPDAAVASVFWIRLYGTLKDLAEVLSRHEMLTRAFAAPDSPDGAVLEGVMSLLAQLRAELSEEELVYLQYRRHVECHPFSMVPTALARDDWRVSVA